MGRNLTKSMIEESFTVVGTKAGQINISHNKPMPPPSPGRDWMSELMHSSLRNTMTKQTSLTPRTLLPAPLIGRDRSGRLSCFESDQMEKLTDLKGPGGHDRQPSFDGLASSQRGEPLISPRYGPGPDQWCVGPGHEAQTNRPRPTTAPPGVP